MLTFLEFRTLLACFKYTSRTNLLPLNWDESYATVNSSRLRIGIFAISLVLSIWDIFFYFSVVKSGFLSNDFTLIALYANLGLVELAGFVFKLTIWTFPNEFVNLANQIIKLNAQFGVKYYGTKFVKANFREKMYLLVQVNAIGVVFTMFIVGIYMPNQNSLRVLEETFQFQSIFANLIHFGLMSFLRVNLAVYVSLVYAVLFASVFSMKFWTRQISVIWPFEESRHKDGYFQESIRIYKSVFLLNDLNNIVYGRFFLPFIKIFLILVMIVGFYGVIRHRASITLFLIITIILMSGTCILCLGIIVQEMSELYNFSRHYRPNLLYQVGILHPPTRGIMDPSSNLKKKVLQKTIKSCQPIRCSIGGLYYLESEAKLTVANTCIQGNIFLLVNLS